MLQVWFVNIVKMWPPGGDACLPGCTVRGASAVWVLLCLFQACTAGQTWHGRRLGTSQPTNQPTAFLCPCAASLCSLASFYERAGRVSCLGSPGREGRCAQPCDRTPKQCDSITSGALPCCAAAAATAAAAPRLLLVLLLPERPAANPVLLISIPPAPSLALGNDQHTVLQRAPNCLSACTRCSVTIVGAVSPPGGDFSDPVTTATLSIVQASV